MTHTLYAAYAEKIDAVLAALEAEGALPPGTSHANVSVEPPRDPAHGDLATNAAMVLAKVAGAPPRALAERLAPLIAVDAHVDKAEIAGPGFINLTLKPAFWPSVLRMVLEQGAGYGRSAVGKGAVS